MLTIAAFTLGCKVNQYDTRAMIEQFIEAGYEEAPFDGDADVYLINTCTVTAEGDRKSRQMIRKAARNNPEASIIVTGCLAQRDPESLAEPGVRLILGTQRRSEVVTLLEKALSQSEPLIAVHQTIERSYEPLTIRAGAEGRTRATLKIEEGCDAHCTYCIIPSVRGGVRSRPLEDIAREAARLGEKGYQELTLTGVNLSLYGRDLPLARGSAPPPRMRWGCAPHPLARDSAPPPRMRLGCAPHPLARSAAPPPQIECDRAPYPPGDRGGITLADAARAAASASGAARIRLGSLEPTLVSQSFIEQLRDIHSLCPHFPLALQSGCNATLRRMGRLYTTEDYRRAADMLRSAYPGAAITTDIIIGFPGETEDEFEETLSFVREIGFSRIHVFPYSPREGTPAARMRAHVSADVKRERTRRMIELGRELERSYVERMIGQIRSVLFERETDVGAEGYTREYIRTAARGARAGTLRDVCLTDFHGDCASGVLI